MQESRVTGEKLEERLAFEPEGDARGLGASVPSAHSGERLEDAQRVARPRPECRPGVAVERRLAARQNVERPWIRFVEEHRAGAERHFARDLREAKELVGHGSRKERARFQDPHDLECVSARGARNVYGPARVGQLAGLYLLPLLAGIRKRPSEAEIRRGVDDVVAGFMASRRPRT